MFFRRGVRDDGHLPTKIALFTVGALIALVGMALRNDWVIGLAGIVLAAGFLLRFIPGGDDGSDAEGPDHGD